MDFKYSTPLLMCGLFVMFIAHVLCVDPVTVANSMDNSTATAEPMDENSTSVNGTGNVSGAGELSYSLVAMATAAIFSMLA